MKKLIQQRILILTLAAFAISMPGCDSSKGDAEDILPEQGNEEDEPDSGGGGKKDDGDDGEGGELEGDSGGKGN